MRGEAPPPEAANGVDAIDLMLSAVERDHVDAQRWAVRRASAIADALAQARRRPWLFTVSDGGSDVESAERAALFDLALRLHLSEDQIRRLSFVADTVRERLPEMWRHANEGMVAWTMLDAVTTLAHTVDEPDQRFDHAELAARRTTLLRELDSLASDWALTLTPAAFRGRLRRLRLRWDADDGSARHARAMRDRRVVVEHLRDGVSWVSALVSTSDALAISRRLTSTAKNAQKRANDPRPRDAIRADLFSSWLRGEGTETAVTTTVFVTVPVQSLTGDAAATVRREGTAVSPDSAVLARQPHVVGFGEIDEVTAHQLLLDAGEFRRVFVDPVRGVMLDMDRRARSATAGQRAWLALKHGLCARDGCTRLAVEADVDHSTSWSQGGLTNAAEMRPLCPRDHRHRHASRHRYHSRDDGSVEVTTATGHMTHPPPPF